MQTLLLELQFKTSGNIAERASEGLLGTAHLVFVAITGGTVAVNCHLDFAVGS